ncbi:hypothetical protein CERZMDRAFT_89369 [Cercospora zeae-maydis SCOH1-5]|uniref:DUF6604 domain-containing protein n=1 Tax=Cercospora zeae-maydis SCOH1-5 TaxID=717836 RepID=A0A6A6F213_9PEZI|nr:hypothetical protein CERZMDRAFT_89369 [Cercospora zeae-maydis SCOH1-5]
MAPDRPSPYRSRYLLYKKGSQQVATWLRETASRLGHSKPLDQLRAIDLLSFAQTISNATPKLELPANIASTLSDVIYLRQQAHEWYTSLDRDGHAADKDRIASINASHKFFIDVLKRVRTVLLSLAAKKTASDQQQQQEQKFLDSDLANIFASLDLEEPSDSPLGSVCSTDTSNATGNIFTEKPEDERPFKLWCMLEDFRDIRLYTRQLWRRYHNGELTFPVAAYVTDVAFRMITDIVSAVEYESLRQYISIVHALDLKIDQDRVLGIYEFSSAVDEGVNGLEAADRFCVSGWCILRDLSTSLQIDRGVCPPRSQLTYLDAHPLGAALREIRSQLQLLAAATDTSGLVGCMRLDYFTYNLLVLCRHEHIHTAAVVQCQMYMDIYNALGGQSAAVADTLAATAVSVQRSYREYLNAWQAAPGYAKSIQQQSGFLLELTNVAIKDEFPSADVPSACKPSLLFAVLPVLAGQYLYELHRRQTSFSTQCANHGFETLGAAYLYSAMKDKPKWTNVALLLKSHTNYVPQGSSLDKHTRNFEKALGAKMMARRRPAGKGLPVSTIGAQASLDPTYYDKAVKLSFETRSESGEMDQFAGMVFETVRLHRGKRFTSRIDDKRPVDLLSAFAQALIHEEAKTSINYFLLAVHCRSMFSSITKDFASRLQALLGDPSASNSTCQAAVHAILREASDVARGQTGHAAQKTSATILDSLGPYFERIIRLEQEQKLVPRAFSGCIADQDKPCNRWSWTADNRPGYINGKKMFGPETPWDCFFREGQDKVRAIMRAAIDRWEEAQRNKGTTGLPMEERLRGIENWAQQEFLRERLPVRLERVEHSGPMDYIGFEGVPCMKTFMSLYRKK